MAAEEYLILTYSQKDPDDKPIMHAYGPYTQTVARRKRREMGDDFLKVFGPKGPPGVTHIRVSKAIKTEDYNPPT